MDAGKRALLALGGSSLVTSAVPRSAWAQAVLGGLPAGTVEAEVLEALPGKVPLIKRTYRPPNYETPLEYFREPITPNRAFFVRYHLAAIPVVEPAKWALLVGGEAADRDIEFTLRELNRMPQVELTAVNQCSGNRRGLHEPHVPGVEWSVGAMGNARWRGVRLKDVLAKAGVKKEAVEVVMRGADSAVIEKTPDFVKSIPIAKALDENTLIALQMNGEPLPHWHGQPARIIVPGWTGTYWIKHLTALRVVDKPFDGFWMKSAYRVPLGKFPSVDRFSSQETAVNTPITEMVVNSLITSHRQGDRIAARRPLVVKGLAWDGGYGIRTVEVSIDAGRSWRAAELEEDLGRFSFRGWRFVVPSPDRGPLAVLVRASNAVGQTQTAKLINNPPGYHHNVIQRLDLSAA